MSNQTVLRLFMFHAEDPARSCWHLAEVDSANPGRILRFVKQSRTRLFRARDQWRRLGGPLSTQQDTLLSRRLSELDAHARIAALIASID